MLLSIEMLSLSLVRWLLMSIWLSMISVKKKNGIDANSNPNPIATGIKHLPALSEGRQQLKLAITEDDCHSLI